ncbi:hypothetical protein NONO_c28550 [Nocardia nova SH22a]|uniref:Uncharacterized protein n=1 Tax=Nocardia nova SH22a TaxID=1415166 RepID=W5TEI4_9NOCA|nr:hypothetical protein [Nocardia nova]AHH17647.1 hypothetical protein NONO_c28550 [Nocardia nova SH22a]
MTTTMTQPEEWTEPGAHPVVGELPPEHQLSAIMEISAHLDVLASQGRVGHDDADIRRYAPAA